MPVPTSLQQQAAARAANTAAAQGARPLVAQARVSEGWAWRNLGDPGRSIAACQEAEKVYREVGNRAGQAAALTARAGALYDQGALPGAKAGYEQALATYREIGDQNGVARALNNIAVVLKNQGDLTSAKAMYEQTLTICRETGDKMGIASTLNNEAAVLSQEGNLQAARDLFEQALTLRRELGDQSGIAYALSNIGGVLRLQGDLAGARAKHEEALNIRNSINQRIGSVASLNNLGRVLLDTGNLASAKKEFDEALTACGEIQNKSCTANALSGLAEVALLANEPESAARQAQEALSIRDQIGERRAPPRVVCCSPGSRTTTATSRPPTRLTAVLEDLAAVQATDQQTIGAAAGACLLGAGDSRGPTRRQPGDDTRQGEPEPFGTPGGDGRGGASQRFRVGGEPDGRDRSLAASAQRRRDLGSGPPAIRGSLGDRRDRDGGRRSREWPHRADLSRRRRRASGL